MSSITLSSTARTVLATAAANADRIACLPERLPVAAQRAVVKSMLIEEVPAEAGHHAWRTTESGECLALRATRVGLEAVGGAAAPAVQGASEEATQGGPGPTDAVTLSEASIPVDVPRPTPVRLRVAAEALVTAWDGRAAAPALSTAMEALRAALVGAGRRTARGDNDARRRRRADTKRARVLGLLNRSEGATVAQVVEVTGWARHPVHGFFAGLKKQGIQIGVLERVRQVGPYKQGAVGSYTVYRIGEAG